MSENRIRKGDMVQPSGPASAGIWVGSDGALRVNPDGTARSVSIDTPTLAQVQAAGATGNVPFWVAPYACEVVSVRWSHSTASTSGTVDVEKIPSGTAPGSGTSVLASTVSTSGTANTPVSGTLAATVASRRLAAGDRLGVKYGGTQTNLVNGVLTVFVRQI